MNKYIKTPESIDEYIGNYPEEIQFLLKSIRIAIRKSAPDAKEAIKYSIPTYTLNGNLVHFGASKNHIGFYPAPSGISAFRKELSQYKVSKGAIQFPFNKKLPLSLISRIVKFRVKENLLKPVKKK